MCEWSRQSILYLYYKIQEFYHVTVQLYKSEQTHAFITLFTKEDYYALIGSFTSVTDMTK